MFDPRSIPSLPLSMQLNTFSTTSSPLSQRVGAQPAASEALKWHCRFGHTSMRNIQKMLKYQLATGLPPAIEPTAFTCSDYLKSKSLRQIVLGPSGSKPDPLDLIVSDVAGSFHALSQGARYMVVFQDVATSYTEAWCIAKRDQVPKVFANYVERMERLTGRKVKMLSSDGAGEYTSKAFNLWCAGKGIVNQQTNRYEHHQNGIAERLIRTLSDMGRTMLHAAGFGEEMWAYAHTAAAHLHNPIPNQVTGLKTPFKALFGKKPHLDYLRTFGKPAVVHIPCKIRRKLDQRGKVMLMVGYPSNKKGWTFWDPQAKKLVTVESSLARFLSDGPPVLPPPTMPQPDLHASKGNLQHILNALELGQFDAERCVEEQDVLVAQMNNRVIKHGFVIPKTYTEAMRFPEADRWLQACKDELQQITEMGVWEASDVPPGKNLTDVGWVSNVKRDGRFKARLVVKDFSQIHGTDFTETFAPTATFAALRTLNVVAARYGLKVRGFDVMAADLNSPLEHEIWVKPLPGLKMSRSMKVLKALYGTKQGARCWWKFMDEQLRKMGFSPSQFDASFYVLRRGDDLVMVWVHVDDGAVVGNNNNLSGGREEFIVSH